MRFFLLLVLQILTLNFARGQNDFEQKTVEVIYGKAIENDKIIIKDNLNFIKGLEYKLEFTLNEALFSHILNMQSDSRSNYKRLINLGGGKGIFYKNINSNENLWKEDTSKSEGFLVQRDFVIYDWELSDETKNILGFKCYKAYGSYKEYNYFLQKEQTISVVAWYVPSLPFSFGPSGFDGLPGLVLESIRGKIHLIATDFNILKIKNLERPSGRVISYEEYSKELYKNVMDVVEKKK